MPEDAEQLRRELQEAREELQRFETFLAVVAHELRNPIAPVTITLDALLLQVEGNTIEHDRLVRMLQSTRRYVDTLRLHLDRLLDFSRLRAKRLDLRPEDVDLSLLVGNVVDGMAPMLQAARCQLVTAFTIPLIGHWDKVRLSQVIWNLMSNAIKYAPGAPIEVRTSRVAEGAELRVTDHGPGIPADQRELVFRKFERASARAHTGFGVGLWLVRSIVEAMHGRVDLISDFGKGSTFVVTLPTQRRSE